MSIDVRVPSTGNAGEDVVVAEWMVAVGAQVTQGDILVTLETAKATMEVEAPASGQVLALNFAAGDEVPEHEVLAVIGEPGEAPVEPDDATSRPDDATSGPRVRDATASGGSRITASPRARILAERNAVDLNALTGSGPGGRIIVADVLTARDGATAPVSTPAPAASAAPAASLAPPRAQPEFTVVPVRGARKITAQRMHDSLQSTAQVTLTRYADASALLSYVARLRAVTDARSLPKIGVNDALMFATANAVARHPEANSIFEWDGIRQYKQVNLGFAVDTGQALLVPVIPEANLLSLAELSAATATAIGAARAGTLTLAEMEGGTFTVSNLGGLGIHWFTPVLNAPQSCILGIGAAHRAYPDAPAQLPLSLTFDHRALDGAAAATVLADIARAIESVDTLAAF
jgi:pyruvate dehydrogenase E2 component (dihydrolipoamide acetyltransferase)